MSIYQDYLSSLSELERLAELTRLPHLLEQISEEEWPLAMLACALHHGTKPEMLEHTRHVYRCYQSKVPLAIRMQGLATLAGFLMTNQGKAWRALIPCALEEEDRTIRRQASSFIATLAADSDASGDSLVGVSTLTEMICDEKGAPSTALEALVNISDRRVAPSLEMVSGRLSSPAIAQHLRELQATPSQLYFDWLCSLLSHHPQLSSLIMECLVRSVSGHEEVIDLVLPMPSWKFKQAAAQPLHSWTRAEYFARMLHKLQDHLTAEQLEDLRQRFIHA